MKFSELIQKILAEDTIKDPDTGLVKRDAQGNIIHRHSNPAWADPKAAEGGNYEFYIKQAGGGLGAGWEAGIYNDGVRIVGKGATEEEALRDFAKAMTQKFPAKFGSTKENVQKLIALIQSLKKTKSPDDPKERDLDISFDIIEPQKYG